VLAALLAATPPAPTPELPVADGRIGPWRMSAATYVDQTQSPPTIQSRRCSIRRRGFSLALERYGGVDLYFGGDGTGFSLAGVGAVTIDDARWEARRIPIPPVERYADVDYPQGHPQTLGRATEYVGVRRSAAEPWLHLPTLVDELAEGRRLAVEHEGGIFRMSLAGLDRAMRWCASAMESERARRFRRP
jgi:hypothetical protein